MSTFNISNSADWLTAIADSQLVTPVYTTYQLATNLTFNTPGQFYLSTGAAQTDFLKIGLGQIFDGNNYSLYFEEGCQPTGGLSGFIYGSGSSGSYATIQNVSIINTTTFTTTVSNYFLIGLCQYTNISNIIISVSSASNVSTFIVSSFLSNNINYNNISVYSSQTPGTIISGFSNGGSSSISNFIVQVPLIPRAGFINQVGAVSGINSLTINNVYFNYYSQTSSIPAPANQYLPILFRITGAVGITTDVTVTNLYCVFGTYSTNITPTTNLLCFTRGVNNSTTFTYNNVYANIVNGGTWTLIGNTNAGTVNTTTGFGYLQDWSSLPVAFTGSGFNTSVAPYRLQSFLDSPFNSSVYSTFDAQPSFDNGVICFLTGTKILCFQDSKTQYINVENLKEGTLVRTLKHGYLPITMIGCRMISSSVNNDPFERLYCYPKEKSSQLLEDLYITGGHSLLVDTLSTQQEENIRDSFGRLFVMDQKYRLMACFCSEMEPITLESNQYIWHFSLPHENKFFAHGIYANGLLVESCPEYIMEKSQFFMTPKEEYVEAEKQQQQLLLSV